MEARGCLDLPPGTRQFDFGDYMHVENTLLSLATHSDQNPAIVVLGAALHVCSLPGPLLANNTETGLHSHVDLHLWPIIGRRMQSMRFPLARSCKGLLCAWSALSSQQAVSLLLQEDVEEMCKYVEAAAHLPAVQPHQQGGDHRRAGLRVEPRQVHLRQRCAPPAPRPVHAARWHLCLLCPEDWSLTSREPSLQFHRDAMLALARK